jgi:hypothetical protein
LALQPSWKVFIHFLPAFHGMKDVGVSSSTRLYMISSKLPFISNPIIKYLLICFSRIISVNGTAIAQSISVVNRHKIDFKKLHEDMDWFRKIICGDDDDTE